MPWIVEAPWKKKVDPEALRFQYEMPIRAVSMKRLVECGSWHG